MAKKRKTLVIVVLSIVLIISMLFIVRQSTLMQAEHYNETTTICQPSDTKARHWSGVTYTFSCANLPDGWSPN